MAGVKERREGRGSQGLKAPLRELGHGGASARGLRVFQQHKGQQQSMRRGLRQIIQQIMAISIAAGDAAEVCLTHPRKQHLNSTRSPEALGAPNRMSSMHLLVAVQDRANAVPPDADFGVLAVLGGAALGPGLLPLRHVVLRIVITMQGGGAVREQESAGPGDTRTDGSRNS